MIKTLRQSSDITHYYALSQNLQQTRYHMQDTQGPFGHIHKQIIMPRLVKPTNVFGESLDLFEKPIPDIHLANKLDEGIRIAANSLIENLNSSIKIFQEPQRFIYTFPDSKFPAVKPGERSQITYEQKHIVEEENTFKDRLSAQQIEQIAENGEFKVRSNIQYITLPYVWKINETIFWGKQKMIKVWHQGLANIFAIMYKAGSGLQKGVPQSLGKISSLPGRLFSLFFGIKAIKVAVDVDYERQLLKDFWQKAMQNNYSQSKRWGSALWNYLFINYKSSLFESIDQQDSQAMKRLEKQKQQRLAQYQSQVSGVEAKKTAIQNIQNEFVSDWAKLKKRVYMQVAQEISSLNNSVGEIRIGSQEDLLFKKQNGNTEDKTLQRLAQRRFNLYTAHLEKRLPEQNVPKDVVQALVFLLQLYRIIGLKWNLTNKAIKAQQLETSQSIRIKHPVKSLYPPYYDYAFNYAMDPIRKALKDDFFQKLKEDHSFTNKLSEKQLALYRQFVAFRANYESLLEAKKNQINVLYEPQRVFRSNYLLSPPYKIVKTGDIYTLKKVSDDITVDTSSNFWKCRLYAMRIKTWTINMLMFLVYQVWKGHFGFRCLYGIADFEHKTGIQYYKGTIYHHTRSTVIGTFLKVIDGIGKSRKTFQDLPDLGLFGKNVSRIFNYLECYVFRFIFVGVFLTLIVYPVSILVVSTFMTVLMVTFWAWMPIILMVTYLFNVLLFQFETNCQYGSFKIKVTPLFGIIFTLIFSLATILFKIIMAFLLAPIASFFVLLFIVVRRGLRTVTDCILLAMISKLGRTPSRNSAVARKISGPGMSKEYYMSITEEDVYVLTQSQMQKLYLAEFHRIVSAKISQNNEHFYSFINFALRPFSLSYYSQGSPVTINSQAATNNYQQQYFNHLARYPRNPSMIRFTQEEIDSYFENSMMIVRNFVEKHQMRRWVFEQFQLYEDMYDELTRAIWIRMFRCGEEIFEPLEKLDQRFKLEDQYGGDAQEVNMNMKMKRSVNSIAEALQGQVKLHHNKQRLTPFKHNLLSRQQALVGIASLFSLHSLNSQASVHLDRQDATTLMVPHLNIEQLCKQDKYRRSQNIKAYPHIIL